MGVAHVVGVGHATGQLSVRTPAQPVSVFVALGKTLHPPCPLVMVPKTKCSSLISLRVPLGICHYIVASHHVCESFRSPFD